MFDKAIYINLDHRNDRKEEIEKELKEIGIDNFERFPAVKHDHAPSGCTLSHINVLKKAKENKYKSILILEDDFKFIVSKNDFWKLMEAVKDVDYDIIMLGYNNEVIKRDPFNNVLDKVNEAQTTSGYMVNSKFYDTLINNYEESLGKSECDQYWKRIQPQNKWYSFKNQIGIQRKSFSNVGKQMVNYKTGGKHNRKYTNKRRKNKRRKITRKYFL